ncbi:MAG: FRG domain-containing protein [Bacteroidia bacterium]
MEYPSKIIIKSLSEYIKVLEERISDRYRLILFRGQNTDKPLIPKIARYSFKKSREVDEINMFNDFVLNAKPYLNHELTSKLDQLIIAQHHGVPTRLLDWTENALTALYFATENPPQDSEEYIVVWVVGLDRNSNIIIKDSSIDPFKINSIKFYKPPSVISRISSQMGWLSLHPYLGSGFYNGFKIKNSENLKLTKLMIPKEYRKNIHENLNNCGVNKFTIYQDLDSLGKYIFEKYKK